MLELKDPKDIRQFVKYLFIGKLLPSVLRTGTKINTV